MSEVNFVPNGLSINTNLGSNPFLSGALYEPLFSPGIRGNVEGIPESSCKDYK